jgi:gliding motility-associated-like protein
MKRDFYKRISILAALLFTSIICPAQVLVNATPTSAQRSSLVTEPGGKVTATFQNVRDDDRIGIPETGKELAFAAALINSRSEIFSENESAVISAVISSQTNVNCYGDSTGSATVTASGGTAPYTYSWSTLPVQTTATAINLAAGNYSVEVEDAAGNTTTATVTITQPAASLEAEITAENEVTCFGGNDGSATVSVTGGTAPYYYTWYTSPQQHTATATNLSDGTYACIVIDVNGCMVAVAACIHQPVAALTVNIAAQTNATCSGNGSATASASGGTAPYSYSWNTSPVQTTATATNLVAGNYIVSVTDSNNCTATATVSISQSPGSLTANISAQSDVSCLSSNNGSATVTASGGTTPYTYSWSTSPVQTSATATNLAVGNYTVTVTDANNCTATATVAINHSADSLVATIVAQTNVDCYGDFSGSVTVNVTGGVGPYSYSWNLPSETAATISNIPAGSYSFTVTDSTGCSASLYITITQPSAPLSASISAQSNAACNGGGSATVSASGGTGPYSYSWNTSPVQATATATNLSAGNYTATVTDANGCTSSATVSISGSTSTLSATITSHSDVTCLNSNNGSATVTASGGTTPYTYSWSTSPVQTSATATNLALGNYTVTVTDANNCTATATVAINHSADSLVATIVAQTNVDCYGDFSGSVTVNVTGGVGPYSYSWNLPSETAATISNIPAGSYSFTVTDSAGCSASLYITITQPSAPLSASISAQSNAACNGGGSATVSASGGTGPYNYSWNTSPVQTTATATNLSAGNYTATVTDANGCTSSVTVSISGSTSTLSATITSHSDVTCLNSNNGSATVTASGGTTPYTYSWSTSPVQTSATATNLAVGNYTVTVTDANNCTATATVAINHSADSLVATIVAQTNVDCYGDFSGSVTVNVTGGVGPYSYSWNLPSETAATISNIPAGSYSFTVTDSTGCSASLYITITQPSAPLSASISAQSNAACNGGGSATVNASGGTGPYSYSWNTSPVQTTVTATNLSAGNYTATVTDSNGCTSSATVSISPDPGGLSATISSHTDVSCASTNDGSATVSVSGGTSPYSYSWSTSPVQTTATATNLAAGNYTVTVTDANNCTATATVAINQSNALTVTITSQTNVSCYGDFSGSVTVSVTGGVGPYFYSWSLSSQTATTVSNIPAGTYTFTVYDASGCSASLVVNITQPAAPLSASTAIAGLSCAGGNNGSINVSASGGTAPYVYAWSGPSGFSSTSEDISNLSAGTYSLVITDAAGCTHSLTQILNEPDAISFSTVVTNPGCASNSGGAIDLSVGGGTSPYTYAWSGPNNFSAQSEDLSALAGGTYTVNITDANGCTASGNVMLTPSGNLVLLLTPHVYPGGQNITCTGSGDGSIDLGVSGGSPAYTFAWTGPNSFSAVTEDISQLAAGTYSVTVNDASGCEESATLQLTEPLQALSETNIISNVSCGGDSTGAIDLTVTGGSPGYVYIWTGPGNFSASTQDISNLYSGTYSVLINDINGCWIVDSMTVTEPVPVMIASQLSSYNGVNVSCAGSADGSIDLIVTGGIPGYTFSWSGPQGYSASTEDISSLIAGAYTISVTDANGCQVTTTITLTGPSPLATTSVITNANCAGWDGAVSLSVSGGTQPYVYSWSNGSQLEDIFSLEPGDYIVFITDANNCSLSDTFRVEQNLFTLSGLATNAACSGPGCSITLSMLNGMSPYSFNWSNGSTLQDLVNVGAGTYIITVTDSMGCTAIDTFTVYEPQPITLGYYSPVLVGTYNISSWNGNDGSIDLTPSGGTAPYSYSWSNGQSTEDISGLSAGTYTVVVTDASGCSDTGMVVLTAPMPLEMPTGYSPNGDGANDYFVIHGIEVYPQNHIEVYNRWGNLVYEADNYINKWDGRSLSGDDLPDATYFVVFSVKNEDIVLKNYVDIRR